MISVLIRWTAYLSDVDSRREFPYVEHGNNLASHTTTLKQFTRSVWFTRGWTLQELLAPARVVFFDRHWVDIGSKSSLHEAITDRTGIIDFLNWEKACVAQKMSWAARRKTTRLEDEAYCLMGLFGVNMPLLYGEGSNAFMRLQLEIIESTNDESIFAWKLAVSSGLLAGSPTAFVDSGRIRRLPSAKEYREYRRFPFFVEKSR